jgi:hypothetical protein
VATGSVPPSTFKDPQRKQKLAAAFPEIEKLFKASAERMPVRQPRSNRRTRCGALRGSWKIECERGWLDVGITLAPTMPPRIQAIGIAPVLPPDAEMTKTAELLVKLLGSWDAKAVEVVAANFDGERARRQFAAASAWAVANSARLLVETASGAQINERGSYSVTRTALRALSVSTRTIKKNPKDKPIINPQCRRGVAFRAVVRG